jgi:hypothetical protein
MSVSANLAHTWTAGGSGTDIIRCVKNIRIESVEHPFDTAEVLGPASILLARLAAMGLTDDTDAIRCLRTAEVTSALEAMGKFGLAARSLAEVQAGAVASGEDWTRLLRSLNEILEESPVPSREWDSLLEVLGTELLEDLLDVSSASIRRYASGARKTPDDVADRLHFLALVVADLAGAYNDLGIRRWFVRSRSALGGRSPRQLLARGWLPEKEGPRRVRELAASLVGSPAT